MFNSNEQFLPLSLLVSTRFLMSLKCQPLDSNKEVAYNTLAN